MLKEINIDLPIAFEDPGHEALVAVWWTGNLLKKVSRRFFRRFETTEARFNLLMALKYAGGPLTQIELGRRLLTDKSNVTGLIDALERLGLIERNAVEGDRRSNHITLTESGRSRIDKLDAQYKEVVAGVMAFFTAEEQAGLKRLMKKLRLALAERETGDER